uniref:Uncharacterized protein n=1 Tax=Anguilla anguilla TaxID=7936 RepID=A0A0E9SW49_ANGAN
MKARLSAIKPWMGKNFLKLNSEKTEASLMGSQSILSKAGNVSLSVATALYSPPPLPTILALS